MKVASSLVAFSLLLVPAAASAAQVTLTDCITDAGFSGDHTDRAFYFRDYPAANLGQVDVRLNAASGGFLFTLTAHDQTFDGPVIGTASAGADSLDDKTLTFDFRGAPVVPHHLIAFVVTYTTDGGAIPSMDVGNTPCALEETNGSMPPLDSDRRESIGARARAYAPEIFSVSPNMGSPAGGSTVNITSSFVGPGAIVTFGDATASSIGIPDGGVGEGGVFTAVTPAHAEGEVDVDISVTYVNDGGVDAGVTASLHNGYFYGSDVTDSGGGGGGGGGTGDSGATTSRADGGDNGASGGGDDSGCGCDLPGTETAPGSFAIAFVAVGALLGARRRRKR